MNIIKAHKQYNAQSFRDFFNSRSFQTPTVCIMHKINSAPIVPIAAPFAPIIGIKIPFNNKLRAAPQTTAIIYKILFFYQLIHLFHYINTNP